jgi:hypothetical protein
MSKTTTNPRASVAIETADELAQIARQGVHRAFGNGTEDDCPYGHTTAQGIIWLQAFRLTTDRMSDAQAAEPATSPFTRAVAPMLTVENARRWEACPEKFLFVDYDIISECGDFDATDARINYVERAFQNLLASTRG